MCLKMSVHLSVVYVCLPACVSVVLSIYLSICLSIYLYLSICRSVHLSVSICFYLRSKDHRSSTDHITDPTHIVNMCESLYVYVSSCLSICLSSMLASDAHDAATACNIEKTYIHRDRHAETYAKIHCLSVYLFLCVSIPTPGPVSSCVLPPRKNTKAVAFRGRPDRLTLCLSPIIDHTPIIYHRSPTPITHQSSIHSSSIYLRMSICLKLSVHLCMCLSIDILCDSLYAYVSRCLSICVPIHRYLA